MDVTPTQDVIRSALRRTTRSATRPAFKRYSYLLTVLCLPFLLSACRLVFVIEGEGFVLATSSGVIHRQGAVIQIDAAYGESFRPVPHPGHSFAGWGALCRNQAVECPVTVPESLIEFDVEGALEPGFLPGYVGPLQLTGGSFYETELPADGPLVIPLDGLDIQGLAAGDAALQIFLATVDLSFVLVGERSGDSVEFNLSEPGLTYEDLWVLVSGLDSNGVLASVGLTVETPLAADAASLKPYRAAGPYADVIAGCVTADTPFAACELHTLPLVGMETSNPDINAVMDRLVVTHDWMGLRFQQFLQRMPPDMLSMFRGITAVVVGANVRPSFYLPLTGAIHIDPALIWLRNEEKTTISDAPDFRQDFGEDLSFLYAAEYLEGVFAAFEFFSLDDNRERTVAEAERLFGIVMFHELAHANDFFPPGRMAALDLSDTPIEAFVENEEFSATTQLEATYPLSNELVKAMAEITFEGVEATAAQRLVTASQVGTAFASDNAVDFYGHYTGFEDSATLVDQVMSRYHFGIDYLAAFVTRPAVPEDAACDDFKVGFGQLGRIGDPMVSARAALVLQVVLGRSDVSQYFANIPPARTLPAGQGYCEAAFSVLLRASSGAAGVRRPHSFPAQERPVNQLPRVLRLYR